MATDAAQKPIHSLILDTGPLIKNAVSISTIINSAEEIFTTPAIISEIRDEATRSRVQTTLMPFLKVRNPSPASYDAVVAFSKKTGDFSVLSRQDLEILALAYEVHCERNGGPWGLREAPKQPLKTKPGEEQKEEDEEEVTGEIQKDEDIQVDAQEKATEIVKGDENVKAADDVKVTEQQQEEDTKDDGHVKSKAKKNNEQRPRKERGSAKHLQMKAEKEKKKQARALGLQTGEQPPAEQQNEDVETSEVDQSGGGVSIEEQPTEQIPAQSATTTVDNTPEQNSEKATVDESQQPSASVDTQAQVSKQAQAPSSQQEDIAAEPEAAQSTAQATEEAPVETKVEEEQDRKTDELIEPAPQDSEVTPASESLSQDVSGLSIDTPPSPPATDDEDSDGDWITPLNLTKRKAVDSGLPADRPLSPQSQLDVATMTIDFAMQNVLLQMNLQLLSTNMQRIKHLVAKVLRCHACFLIVKDVSKQFCPRCGGASLRRVNCSTNSKGEFRLHLAKNYQINKRGDKYSIPKPIAGTANTKWSGIGGGQGGWGRDLILAEDQKEYVKQVEQEKRSKGARDLMDDDYLPGILTGDRSGRAGGRMKVGAGKNVNSKRTR
jgi:RNA-binding protein NOB1